MPARLPQKFITQKIWRMTLDVGEGDLQGGSKMPETARVDFISFLERYGVDALLAEKLAPEAPLVYWSMEFYDKEENGIKGGGGLGVLAADTRRLAEQLAIPLVIVTPFYRAEYHQSLDGFSSTGQYEPVSPGSSYRFAGRVMVKTAAHSEVEVDIYSRELGSTKIIAVTEPGFGEMYPGENSADHRLYQEMVLGFAGYQTMKDQEIEPSFMQLNEAPTVFAAIAMLDELCMNGKRLEDALMEVKRKTLYTNHTLVQAVEGEFEKAQFDHIIMPNISSSEVKAWINALFNDDGRLKLSLLAIELSGMRSGVSKLHAEVANFTDASDERVRFEAVTNGIADTWIMPKIKQYMTRLGVLDEFGLPTPGYERRLEVLSIGEVRRMRLEGRRMMNGVLAERIDQYGNPIIVPEAAPVFDFKRRFARYKRPDMIFSDPQRLAELLKAHDAHFLLAGKPHPMDEEMKLELTRLLEIIDRNEVLKERVHYIQDYDEAVGRALSFGADCAVNVPVVGQEACGTSFMKDIANFKVLISTPDGGVADVQPIACLEVSGDEVASLYENIDAAARIIGDDEMYLQQIILQLKGYIPVLSGARMMGEYMKLFARSL